MAMNHEKLLCLFLLFLIAVLVAGTVNLPAQPPSQELADEPALKSIEGTHIWTMTRELPFDSGGSLRLRNRNGEITVTTWDEPRVRIRAEKRMRVRREGFTFLWFHSKGKIPFKTVQEAEDYFRQLKVEISGDAREVVVETEFPERKKNVNLAVDYEIHLPRQAAVDLQTSNGEISLTGIQGSAKLRSSNGKLACTDLGGALDARTSNGEIVVGNVQGEVKLSSTNGKLILEDVTGTAFAETSNGAIFCLGVIGIVDLETSNGKIELVHPQPISASESIACRTSNGAIHLSLGQGSSFDLEADTSNGHVSTDFPVTASGKISSKRVSGKVGQGGPRVGLHSSNGSISIKRQ